jgi:hypothetical protein
LTAVGELWFVVVVILEGLFFSLFDTDNNEDVCCIFLQCSNNSLSILLSINSCDDVWNVFEILFVCLIKADFYNNEKKKKDKLISLWLTDRWIMMTVSINLLLHNHSAFCLEDISAA